jgi:hypothetical protein
MMKLDHGSLAILDDYVDRISPETDDDEDRPLAILEEDPISTETEDEARLLAFLDEARRSDIAAN